MALIKCNECGKEISDQATTCPHCGNPVSQTTNTSNQPKCPKCGSSNIVYQREQSASIGGSVHSFSAGKSKGCLYWLLFGWWVWIFKFTWEIFKFCCTCGLSLFFRKKKAHGSTISASKSINKTVAVCQQCGNTWKV